MAPSTDPSGSGHLSIQKSRFEDKRQVVEELDKVDEEKKEERKDHEQSNYQCQLALVGEGDSDTYPSVMRSMLDRSDVRSSIVNRSDSGMEIRHPPVFPSFLFSPSDTVPPHKNFNATSLMPSRLLQTPIGLVPEMNPTNSGGYLDIITCALECVESIEPYDQ